MMGLKGSSNGSTGGSSSASKRPPPGFATIPEEATSMCFNKGAANVANWVKSSAVPPGFTPQDRKKSEESKSTSPTAKRSKHSSNKNGKNPQSPAVPKEMQDFMQNMMVMNQMGNQMNNSFNIQNSLGMMFFAQMGAQMMMQQMKTPGQVVPAQTQLQVENQITTPASAAAVVPSGPRMGANDFFRHFAANNMTTPNQLIGHPTSPRGKSTNSLPSSPPSKNTGTNSTSSLTSPSSVDAGTKKIAEEINCTQALLCRLNLTLEVNDPELEVPKHARFFIIKSFSEDDVHRAVKYRVWCSTYYGNRRLEQAWNMMNAKYGNDGAVYLFFSVNASGHFCGVAKMTSNFDPDPQSTQDIWMKDEHNEGGKNTKWRGKFNIEWLYIKDIPNVEFSRIRLENNGNKPMPHSRDTQEVYEQPGFDALKIFHMYRHNTSLLDDFDHYNRQEERQVARIKANTYRFRKNVEKKVKQDRHGNSVGSSSVAHTASSVTSTRSKSSKASGPAMYEVPSVLDNLRTSTVKQMKDLNMIKPFEPSASKTQEVPSDAAAVLRRSKKIGPGPNAIPIIKPPEEQTPTDENDDDSASPTSTSHEFDEETVEN